MTTNPRYSPAAPAVVQSDADRTPSKKHVAWDPSGPQYDEPQPYSARAKKGSFYDTDTTKSVHPKEWPTNDTDVPTAVHPKEWLPTDAGVAAAAHPKEWSQTNSNPFRSGPENNLDKRWAALSQLG